MSPLILIAMAIAPGAAIIWFIYSKDKYEKEPKKLLLWCFLMGVFSIIPALFLEGMAEFAGIGISDNIFITFFFAFGVVGFSEEWSKYLFLNFYAFKRKEFNEPFDGIVYSVMIGMGFAVFENIAYVLQNGFGNAIARALTAVPAHAAFGVIMGYYFGLAKFNKKKQFQYKLTGLLGAIALHGGYDFFLFQQNYPALALLAFVALGLGIRYSLKAIKMHQEASPFKPGNIVDKAAFEVLEPRVSPWKKDAPIWKAPPNQIEPKQEKNYNLDIDE